MDIHSKQSLKPRVVKQVPLLPLRDIIIFPHMVVPLFVGREKSINALEEAMNKQFEVARQKLGMGDVNALFRRGETWVVS